MIRAHDLAQKDPERNYRRIDSIIPNKAGCCQCLLDDLFREQIAERQITVLKKLAAQKSDLLLKPTLVTIAHRLGLLAW
jgi:hypothetical protein